MPFFHKLSEKKKLFKQKSHFFQTIRPPPKKKPNQKSHVPVKRNVKMLLHHIVCKHVHYHTQVYI